MPDIVILILEFLILFVRITLKLFGVLMKSPLQVVVEKHFTVFSIPMELLIMDIGSQHLLNLFMLNRKH